MLRVQPTRIVVHFALNFEPQPGFVRSLSEAFEVTHGRMNVKNWAYSTERYVMRDFEQNMLVAFEYNRIGFLSLGLNQWEARRSEIISIAARAMEIMKIPIIKRMGFKTSAYLDLEMNHAEICDLMFGSFLQEKKRFEAICRKPDDAFLQVHGTAMG